LQLRHTAGTLIRKKFGLEASQAVLGHAERSVTQVYSEVDLAAARNVMAEIG
jgi:site-specific recombinase XerD